VLEQGVTRETGGSSRKGKSSLHQTSKGEGAEKIAILKNREKKKVRQWIINQKETQKKRSCKGKESGRNAQEPQGNQKKRVAEGRGEEMDLFFLWTTKGRKGGRRRSLTTTRRKIGKNTGGREERFFPS